MRHGGRGVHAVLLSQLIDTYAEYRIELRASTVEQLRVAVRLLGLYVGSGTYHEIDTSELSAEMLRGFARCGIEWGRSASTINSKRRSILTLWRFAFRIGETTNKPPGADELPNLREPRRVPVAWSVAEIERLIVAARSTPGYVGRVPRRYWWPALILAIYDTAARVGAMLSVFTSDCDIRERRVLVRAEHTKTWADAVYALHDQTVAAIAAIYDPGRQQLFEWPHCRRHLYQECRRIVGLAGLSVNGNGCQPSHNLFHRIRRTTLSYCAANSLELARQQAGHSDARVTTRSYIDPRIARGQSAVDVIPRPEI